MQEIMLQIGMNHEPYGTRANTVFTILQLNYYQR